MTRKQDRRVEDAIDVGLGVLVELLPAVPATLVGQAGRKAILAALSALGIDTGTVRIEAPPGAKVKIASKKKG